MPKFPIPKNRLITLFPKMRVKYKDNFDLRQFIKDLRYWLIEYGWIDTEEEFTQNWESYYGERVDQSGAKEIWIQWRPKKHAAQSRFTYYMDLYFHCVAITKTEIVRNGKKLAVNKGEVELNIRAYVELAFLKDLEKSKMFKPFKNIFLKRIYKKEIEQRKKELYQEVYTMQNFVKQWFKLKRYLPYEETRNFFKSQAWPSHLQDQ